MNKDCNICHQNKSTDKFYSYKSGSRKGILFTHCKQCEKEIREKKKDKIQAYRETHREEAKQYNQKYHTNHRTERIIQMSAYKLNRRKTDPIYRLQHNFSNDMCRALKTSKNGRHWESLVDYNMDQLKIHLEKQFLPKMTWQNYGKGGWHIDHIKPQCSFMIKSAEDNNFKQCWALPNLCPLWEANNFAKSIQDRKLSVYVN